MVQTTMSIRVDNNLKKDFDLLCSNFGFTSTAAVTVFMKAVVRERKIPFEIKADSAEDIKGKALAAFKQMRTDAAAIGIQDMSLDEINSIISETRDESK